MKTLCLPRPEFFGAVLISERPSHLVPSILTYDSTIVLLNKLPCQWTTFVTNRVTKIMLATRYVNGAPGKTSQQI